MTQIRMGQILLIICCIFYLAWWGVAFHPSHAGQGSGLNVWLFILTALTGLGGMAVNVIGITGCSNGTGFVSGLNIIIGGALIYVLLMVSTKLFLHRQVTTELLLIIGWAVLETAALNAAYILGRVSSKGVFVCMAVILIVAVLSLIFYLLYYRVEPMTGYYFGMVPLVTEAMSMGLFLFITK